MIVEVLEGNLFTGRIYEYKKIRNKYPKSLLVCVMRWAPKYINLKDNKIIHLLGLAPSEKLLRRYRKQKRSGKFSRALMWHMFLKDFMKELQESDMATQDILLVRKLLSGGTDVVLLCHEKIDEEDCHRQALPYLILTGDEIVDVYHGEIKFGSAVTQRQLDW